MSLFNRKRKSEKAKMRTYTKFMVTVILIVSIIWVSFSYVLAAISVIRDGNMDTLESLSREVIIALIGTILGYLLKSFFETKEEGKQKIKQKELEYQNNISDDDSITEETNIETNDCYEESQK